MSRCDTMQWSNLYLLGDEKVDTEHKKLFDLAGLVQTYKENEQNVKDAIRELIKYTKFHFASEERYMQSIEYANLAVHKSLHQKIVHNLNSIIDDMSHQTIAETYKRIVDFINNGLVQHIMVEDKKVQHYKRSAMGLRSLFAWKSDYKLYNEQIDEDHKQLFNIALKALNYERVEDKKQHIRSTIIELNKYMQEHFSREEEYMRSISFPLLEEHKVLHANIIDQINSLIKKLPKMSFDEFEKTLVSYIDIWLVNHIVHEDQKIMCFKEVAAGESCPI